MIKLSNMKWIAAAAITGMLTLTTTSCKDDEPSLQDKQEEIWEQGNDLSNFGDFLPFYNIDVLYGSVKSVTILRSFSSTWENNAIKEDMDHREVVEFDKYGYITKLTTAYRATIGSEQKMLVSNEMTYTRDDKHRVVELVETGYGYDTNGSVANKWGSKITTAYDDNAKTATEIKTTSSDGITYTDNDKKVYQLNRFGRIDKNNYTQYPVKTGFETEPNQEVVTEYDNNGNRVLYYQKYMSGGNTYINVYIKASYVYY